MDAGNGGSKTPKKPMTFFSPSSRPGTVGGVLPSGRSSAAADSLTSSTVYTKEEGFKNYILPIIHDLLTSKSILSANATFEKVSLPRRRGKTYKKRSYPTFRNLDTTRCVDGFKALIANLERLEAVSIGTIGPGPGSAREKFEVLYDLSMHYLILNTRLSEDASRLWLEKLQFICHAYAISSYSRAPNAVNVKNFFNRALGDPSVLDNLPEGLWALTYTVPPTRAPSRAAAADAAEVEMTPLPTPRPAAADAALPSLVMFTDVRAPWDDANFVIGEYNRLLTIARECPLFGADQIRAFEERSTTVSNAVARYDPTFVLNEYASINEDLGKALKTLGVAVEVHQPVEYTIRYVHPRPE